MRAYVIAVGVIGCLCFSLTAHPEPPQANPDDIEGLFKTLQAPNATEAPRVSATDSGFLRFVGAPPGGQFALPPSASKAAMNPETAAREFVRAHAGAFGVVSPKSDHATLSVRGDADRVFVKLQQKYSGFDVFGGQTVVQTDTLGGVTCVLSDIMRDPSLFDTGTISLTPAVRIEIAEQTAIAAVADAYHMQTAQFDCTDAERIIYAPEVLDQPGPPALAWVTRVFSIDGEAVIEKVFVDAHSGLVLLHYSEIDRARQRNIYDANSRLVTRGTLVRSEGDPPSGIADADLAYDYFGDTYDYYWANHGRDSIDGNGLAINGVVRLCLPGYCPYPNAFYVTADLGIDEGEDTFVGFLVNHMYFGEGFAVDDVVAHELTHGVTRNTSNLIYAYDSGAINESFSDIWGEAIDLTNGKGLDTEAVRWYMGEELPIGAIRYMKDPTVFGDPDRVNSPYYYTGTGDNGGVHINSGVGNKLFYLLSDGDTFNGQDVKPVDPTDRTRSIKKATQLFYECQANLLTEGSGWIDLYYALGQATINEGYTFEERQNVQAATRAVEIAPLVDETQLVSFRALPTRDDYGRPVIALNWESPDSALFRRVILVRNIGAFATNPDEGVELFRGRDEKYLDRVVVSGTTYYYTLFADLATGFPSVKYARATAGGTAPDFLTEVFDSTSTTPGVTNPFDLNFTQIVFSPTGAPTAPLDSNTAFADHANYTVKVRRNVGSLPVERDDAWEITMRDDDIIMFPSNGPLFPFFGIRYGTLYLSSNGYIGFRNVSRFGADNYPSLASHYNMPRISFLFSDLNPAAGGSAWAKRMDDRLVVTFENITEWQFFRDPPASNPSTVQVELFWSGRIRITYGYVNVATAVVGLSDGSGVPLNPGDLFTGVADLQLESDLSALPTAFAKLTFEPIAAQFMQAGETISFDANSEVPAGAAIPQLTAEWDGPIYVPFVDRQNGTGGFRWASLMEDMGTYLFRVVADNGAMQAYQDVYLDLDESAEALPFAGNLRLRSNNPVEDPTRNRTVSIDSELIAEYDYSHPLEFVDPISFSEGPTQIMWFRNNVKVSSFDNLRVVPPIATRANDQWFFTVKPSTAGLLQGKAKQSPIVTIVNSPEVLNVALPENVPADFNPGDLPLGGLPLASGPSVGGTTVYILGRRLTHPTSVKFGGVEATSIRTISDNQLEIVTPAHQPSEIAGGAPVPETVIVTTAAGAGVLRDAFVFLDTGAKFAKADINQDGRVDAVDVQLVISSVLSSAKAGVDADVNRDGHTNAADIQAVINEVLNK